MIYQASWRANNNTRPMEDLFSTNKNKIMRDVRSIANGNRYSGSTCVWWVWDYDKNIIAAGMTAVNGRHFMFRDDELADIAFDEGLIFNP